MRDMANEQTNVMTSAGFRAYAADNLEKQAANIKEAVTEAQAAAVASSQASQEAAERAKETVAVLFVGSEANCEAIYNAFRATTPTPESVTVEVDETCPAAVWDEQAQKYKVTVYRYQTVLGGIDNGGAQS